tara:strand:+ start:495 stop:710 length:216 start_codon:yes stop_codon:yes gene_type:complete
MQMFEEVIIPLLRKGWRGMARDGEDARDGEGWRGIERDRQDNKGWRRIKSSKGLSYLFRQFKKRRTCFSSI